MPPHRHRHRIATASPPHLHSISTASPPHRHRAATAPPPHRHRAATAVAQTPTNSHDSSSIHYPEPRKSEKSHRISDFSDSASPHNTTRGSALRKTHTTSQNEFWFAEAHHYLNYYIRTTPYQTSQHDSWFRPASSPTTSQHRLSHNSSWFATPTLTHLFLVRCGASHTVARSHHYINYYISTTTYQCRYITGCTSLHNTTRG